MPSQFPKKRYSQSRSPFSSYPSITSPISKGTSFKYRKSLPSGVGTSVSFKVETDKFLTDRDFTASNVGGQGMYAEAFQPLHLMSKNTLWPHYLALYDDIKIKSISLQMELIPFHTVSDNTIQNTQVGLSIDRNGVPDYRGSNYLTVKEETEDKLQYLAYQCKNTYGSINMNVNIAKGAKLFKRAAPDMQQNQYVSTQQLVQRMKFYHEEMLSGVNSPFDPTFIYYVAPEYLVTGSEAVTYCRVKFIAYINCSFRHRRLTGNYIITSGVKVNWNISNDAVVLPIVDPTDYSNNVIKIKAEYDRKAAGNPKGKSFNYFARYAKRNSPNFITRVIKCGIGAAFSGDISQAGTCIATTVASQIADLGTDYIFKDIVSDVDSLDGKDVLGRRTIEVEGQTIEQEIKTEFKSSIDSNQTASDIHMSAFDETAKAFEYNGAQIPPAA